MIAFEVNDMTCGHCVSMIARAIRQADDGARVEFDLARKRVQIESAAADEAALQAAIEEAGYTPVRASTAAPAQHLQTAGRCCGCH
jgi:copper chaperone